MPDHGTAPCMVFIQGTSVRTAQLCCRGNLFFKKPPCDLHAAHAIQCHGENRTNNLRLPLIDNNSIFHFPALLISQGNLSEHILSGCAFTVKSRFYFDGNVLAVQVINQSLECRVKSKRHAFLLPAVIAVIYSYKIHAHKREHLV